MKMHARMFGAPSVGLISSTKGVNQSMVGFLYRVDDSRRTVSCAASSAPKSVKPSPTKGGVNVPAPLTANPLEGLEDLPTPGPLQQTLKQSFVLSGIGLHTADYAYVRLMPAMAGEGRYFVRVPEGEISQSPLLKEFRNRETEIMDHIVDVGIMADGLDGPITSKALKEKVLADYLAYLEAKEEGYKGTMDDWMMTNSKGLVRKVAEEMRQAAKEVESLEPKPRRRSEDEPYIPACFEFAEGTEVQTVLRNDGQEVRGVEHLLAALEACGVDNCRIEVEGGSEVPIVDGAAQGWVSLILANGTAPCAPTVHGDAHKKMVPRITQPLTVTGKDGAFITAMPDSLVKVTAGVDATKTASAIGRQWFTWNVLDDMHFRYILAYAKTTFESPQQVEALYNRGLVQAGPTNVSIIAKGDEWVDITQLTYPLDEAARHKVVDLTGDLSLLNVNGQGGLPQGHVIAYKADHALQVEFVKKLAQSKAWELVPWAEVEAAAGYGPSQ